MRSKLSLVSIVFLVCYSLSTNAQEDVSLDGYTCSQFLADTKRPADGEKLLKSLMMISWSTGYAAAFQKDSPRADAAAIRLIAATLGDACTKHPDQLAIRIIASAINQFAGAGPIPGSQGSPSLWDQNGSVLSLAADGVNRQFQYENPNAELKTLGVQKGTIFFSGKKIGKKYSGTAYAFAALCEPKAYQVTGDIAEDEKQITLRGRTPELGAGCKIVSYRDESLLFKFLPSDKDR